VQRPQRRLAAILAADIAGYSRLMAADEAGTLARLKQLRAGIMEPKIAQFNGHIVGSAGDSLLVEFASAVDAVQCAVELQQTLEGENAVLPESRRMAFRMGVNLGDVIAEGDTIYGDGVNIASRLEKLAEPGSVCIDRNVYDQVKGKLDYGYSDLGEQRVHNIPEPVHAYRVKPSRPSADTPPAKEFPRLPDKPSIAVLPFDNLSGDRDQEYFADGIVEEIITALSRMRWLFVIARNSSFAYKGRAVDIKQVGRELGVRYVVEGSVRKAGSRVRISGQLIDTATGAHLWADRFDGALENIFDLQDQVTASVVAAIGPKLEQAEIERSRRKPTDNLDAYDHYLRGLAGVHGWTKVGTDDALSNLYRAIELDPNFAAAYGLAARCYVLRKAGGWVTERDIEIAETVRLARRAIELGKDDAVALGTAGMAMSFVVGDHYYGKALTDRAVALNPNLADSWRFAGWVRIWLGEPEAAIECVGHSLRLNPNDPHSFSMYSAMAMANLFADRFTEAVSWAEMAVREKPDGLLPLTVSAASSSLIGRLQDAERTMARLRVFSSDLHC
jgi:TolB-like protein/class 3 adenylate cyclase